VAWSVTGTSFCFTTIHFAGSPTTVLRVENPFCLRNASSAAPNDTGSAGVTPGGYSNSATPPHLRPIARGDLGGKQRALADGQSQHRLVTHAFHAAPIEVSRGFQPVQSAKVIAEDR
jgi:hypothetical protein